jgi:hypothetical protein
MTVVGKYTRELITSHGPQYPTRNMHCSPGDAIKVTSMTDGTTSVVQLLLYGEPIGTGIAKRRKGDERNDEIGMSLALTRAFTDAATRYAATLDGLLNPPEQPNDHILRNLRRHSKQDAIRRKNLRREKARLEHKLRTGWDHNNWTGAFE